MRQLRIQGILCAFLALSLTASLLVACDEEEPIPERSETQTISGRVNDMPLMTPVAGATVQLVANDVDITDPDYVRPCNCLGDLCAFRTTSDAEGWWTLEDVPLRYNAETFLPYDLLIKVTEGKNPPGYNLFTLSLGDRFDLMIMNRGFYLLFALEALLSGADPATLSVMFGATIGFTDMAYPQKSDSLPGVTAHAEGGSSSESLAINYLSEQGLPDPDLTETSSLGAFYFVVPDARDSAMPAINVTGTAQDRVLVGGYYPACPGGFGVTALIDPYYKP